MSRQLPTRRNTLRYPGHDYSQPGTVFLTICLHQRGSLFGDVRDGQVVTSAVGTMVDDCLMAIPVRFRGVQLDSRVVMPDHVHAILHMGCDPAISRGPSTGEVVRWFKASTVESYRTGVAHLGWQPYERRLWQSSFHDRIVRTDRELESIREYIEANPARWWERMQDASDPDDIR